MLDSMLRRQAMACAGICLAVLVSSARADRIIHGLPTPTAYWGFDGNFNDTVGGHHLDPNTGTSISSQERIFYKQAGQFDGTTGANATGYKGVTGATPRTISAWIMTSGVPDQAIVSWGQNVPNQKWTFRTQSTNGTVGGLRLETNGSAIVGNTPLNDGQWHHVAAVFNPTGTPNIEDVTLYVDGVLDAQVGSSNPPNYITGQGNTLNTASFADVMIGDDHADRFYTGLIDEVYIFDEALTAGQIALLAATPVPEPSTMVLFAAAGAFGLFCLRRRR